MPTSKNVKVVAKVNSKPPAAAFKTHWQKCKEDPNTGAKSTEKKRIFTRAMRMLLRTVLRILQMRFCI
jgi:hypothetical protein